MALPENKATTTPEKKALSISVFCVVLDEGRTESIRRKSTGEGRVTDNYCRPEGMRHGCVEGSRGMDLMSSRTKIPLRDDEQELKVCVMKTCFLLETPLESIVGAGGSQNGIIHNLDVRFRLHRGNPPDPEEVRKAGHHTEAKKLRVNEAILNVSKGGKLRGDALGNLFERLWNVIIGMKREVRDSDTCLHPGKLHMGIYCMKLCKQRRELCMCIICGDM